MRSESSSGHQTFQVKMMGFGELSLISTYEWTGYFVLKIIHNDHTLGFILRETSEGERVGS